MVDWKADTPAFLERVTEYAAAALDCAENRGIGRRAFKLITL